MVGEIRQVSKEMGNRTEQNLDLLSWAPFGGIRGIYHHFRIIWMPSLREDYYLQMQLYKISNILN